MTDPESLEARAYEALHTVLDPELGVDVVDLGLVYDVRATGDRVEVDMTLTTIGCPVAESLPEEAREALVEALPGIEVEVEVVWDPPWTPERLTSEAMVTLGFRPRSD